MLDYYYDNYTIIVLDMGIIVDMNITITSTNMTINNNIIMIIIIRKYKIIIVTYCIMNDMNIIIIITSMMINNNIIMIGTKDSNLYLLSPKIERQDVICIIIITISSTFTLSLLLLGFISLLCFDAVVQSGLIQTFSQLL